MAWDDTAKKVAIKSIGQTEARMNYGAVNPTDPVSIGLFQWYGVRAAGLLHDLKDKGSWPATAPLTADLAAHPATDSWWNSRYLTAAERTEMAPILRVPENVAIQDQYAVRDLETYRAAGEAAGLNANTNTDTMCFFVNMYNQSPREALRVLGVVGGNATLDQIYRACLNNAVLGVYSGRYKEAYEIIKAHDTSGVGTGTDGSAYEEGGSVNGAQPTTSIKNIQLVGDQLHIHHADGHVSTARKTNRDIWIANVDTKLGGGAPGTTTGPVGEGDGSKQSNIVQFAMTKVGQYQYGQGPCRLTPDTCGYTDCSAFVRWCYLQTGNPDPGSWGGTQIGNGTLVTTNKADIPSKCRPGDIIFIRWNDPNSPPAYDHTVLFVGSEGGSNGDILSHGGPGPGPTWRNSASYVPTFAGVMVRRYV